MKIVFRVDASVDIGSGHVMRCLTLADELKKRGANTLFVTRAHPGNMADVIRSREHNIKMLPAATIQYVPVTNDVAHALWLGVSWTQDAEETFKLLVGEDVDWLIVDSYALDARWHQRLRSVTRRIMVIDDMSDRKLDCDLLLDQTHGRSESVYCDCVPKYCQKLLGARYALLRPEFSEARRLALKRRENYIGIRKVLVSMGGTDPANVTGLVLEGLAEVNWNYPPQIDVVLGSYAPHIEAIKLKAKQYRLPITISINVENMVDRMLEADLAVGAGGSTSWERCCLGLPTLMIIIADNQKEIVRQLEASCAILNLGDSNELESEDIKKETEKLLGDDLMWLGMSRKAAMICDGHGASKVANQILG